MLTLYTTYTAHPTSSIQLTESSIYPNCVSNTDKTSIITCKYTSIVYYDRMADYVGEFRRMVDYMYVRD